MKLIIEKWKCDRCGIIEDKKPGHPGTAYDVRVFVDYGTAGGPEIEWKEMCWHCNREVGDALANLRLVKYLGDIQP